MNPIMNHLIQLQELALIRDEQKVSGGAEHLQQLDESIQTMTRQLPPDIRDRFEKLHRKDHVVVTPVSEGGCAVCGMRLPISLVQAVRLEREILACPNCTRMLFYAGAAPRRVASASRRTGPRKVGISRFSSQSLMIPRLASEDTEGVIAELARRMETEGFVSGADQLIEAALRREAIISTATDQGLAFPHVRSVEGGALTLAMGVSPKGVTFGGPGGRLTRIVFFIVIPTAASAFYLKLLAGLTTAFVEAEARRELAAEADREQLWKTLCRLTRSAIK
jgi:mannitol/fructose-specific phosphotransferase system IIA component (Ntr-type)